MTRVAGTLVPDTAAAWVAIAVQRYVQQRSRNGAAAPPGATELLADLGAAVTASSVGGSGISCPAELSGHSEVTAGHVTAADVAARLGCTERWARRLLTRGDLSGRRVGRVWLTSWAAVEDYERRRA